MRKGASTLSLSVNDHLKCLFRLLGQSPWTGVALPQVVDFDIYQPFPNQQILDSSKLKDFADNNFKLDENSAQFSKRVLNTGEKGEIALL